MKKTQNNFSDSFRLYRQSKESAEYIFSVLSNNSQPFEEIHRILDNSRLAAIPTQDGIERSLAKVWQHVTTISKNIDPRFALPIFIAMAEKYYFGSKEYVSHLPWLGTAIKTSMSVVWRNQDCINANTKSLRDIIRLLQATGAWEQLHLQNSHAKIFGKGRIAFKSRGIVSQDIEDTFWNQQWNKYTQKRGASHRTLKHSMNVIWATQLYSCKPFVLY